jgi:hypothetical protein
MQKIKKNLKYVSGSTYKISFLLTADCLDLGFFDTYENSSSSVQGTTANLGMVTTITGLTVNKLSTLRTFSQSPLLSKQYITSTSVSSNGLDLSKTVVGVSEQKYVYYIDGITYTTTITSSSSQTVFSFDSVYGNSALFENKRVLKDEKKMHQVEKSRIEPDVFIVRQNLPVLTDNYRIADVKNIDELYKYGSGYFNIINNT